MMSPHVPGRSRLSPQWLLAILLLSPVIRMVVADACAATASGVCGLSPTDWGHTSAADPCGRHPNQRGCRGDPRCVGLPYRGESVVACRPDGHGFLTNCPAVACISLSP